MPVASILNIPSTLNIQCTLSTPNIRRMVIVLGGDRLQMKDTNLREMKMPATALAPMRVPVNGLTIPNALTMLIVRAEDRLQMEDANFRRLFHDHHAAATMLIGQLRLELQEM
jgi:hypothetical protein